MPSETISSVLPTRTEARSHPLSRPAALPTMASRQQGLPNRLVADLDETLALGRDIADA
jgi:hypothetical protein